MKEFVGGLTILWVSATYWLGGQEIPGLKRGYKWIRRFLMPAGLACGLVLISGINASIWKPILASALLCLATHIGYQSNPWKFILAGLCFGVPSLILGFQWTFLLPCAFHGTLGMVSLRDNKFGWSFVALMTGASIGIAYVYAVQ
jgi:hypothetical protein